MMHAGLNEQPGCGLMNKESSDSSAYVSIIIIEEICERELRNRLVCGEGK
jgi:hypothetical protein